MYQVHEFDGTGLWSVAVLCRNAGTTHAWLSDTPDHRNVVVFEHEPEAWRAVERLVEKLGNDRVFGVVSHTLLEARLRNRNAEG